MLKEKKSCQKEKSRTGKYFLRPPLPPSPLLPDFAPASRLGAGMALTATPSEAETIMSLQNYDTFQSSHDS